jgi:tellurite methyltransferase
MMESWSEYFELSKNRPPNSLLENALRLVVNRGQALDLGAGSLKDSKFMLSMGFDKVTAVDADPAVKKYRAGLPTKILSVQIKPFENLSIKKNTYDFISAQFALPFTKPPYLPALIEQICNGLKPCGIFCAQFFGPQDSWAKAQTNMTFVGRSQLKKLLSPLAEIYFQEKKSAGTTIDGQDKQWHLFEVIMLKAAKSRR